MRVSIGPVHFDILDIYYKAYAYEFNSVGVLRGRVLAISPGAG